MGEVIESVFDGVVSYASDNTWILAEMGQRWGWGNCQTHQVSSVDSKQELQAAAPPEVKRLVEDMRIPAPSSRNQFFILGVILLGVSLFLVCRKK